MAGTAVQRRDPAAGFRVLVALALALLGIGWAAGAASAHAELLSVTPADGELLPSAPTGVTLVFSEAVSLVGGSARVLDDTGAEVSGEPQDADTTVTIPLPAELADGTYTVTWQVISADSHRISGGSVFHVGAPSANGPAVVVPGAGDEVSWGLRAGATVFTALGYAGALLAAGGWWFGAFVARRPREHGDDRNRIWGPLVVRPAVLGAAALVAGLPLRMARIGGGLDVLGDNTFLWETLRGPIGVSTGVSVVGLVVLAAIGSRGKAWSVPATWDAGVAGAVALAGFTIEGHTRTMGPRWAMVGFDLVHLGAGAVWLGGIAGLVLAFRAQLDPARVGLIVRRFSAAAVIAVLLVSSAGVAMAWVVLPSLGDLTSTGWGLALLTKVALVLGVVALGFYNRQRLVPSVGAAASSTRRRRLARIVVVELVVLLAVVGVTAVLVGRSPNGSSAAPSPVTTLPGSVELALTGDAGTVQVAVAPARAGSNEISIELVDPQGQPLVPVDTPVVELTEAALGIGPLRPVVHVLGDGSYHVIADISPAGSWDVTIRVRVGEFDASTATTTVEIAP